MINLQITGNNANSSASVASDPQASTTLDALASKPFAALLAQQLDGLNSLASATVQIPLAAGDSTKGDKTEPVTDDIQNQAAILGDQPGNPANIIAAIVLAENRGQKTGGALVTESRKQRTDDSQRIEVDVQRTADKLRGGQSLSLPPGKNQHDITGLDSLTPDALKRMDISAALTRQSRPSASAAEMSTPPALPVAPPNTPLNTRSADAIQTIGAPLGSNGWSNEFSQKISWMSLHKQQVAELHLNPPNLGPLEVVLKISDNQATALFTSPHGAVRDAVENALPKLREMLANNGITLGNATVSDQPPRDRGAEAFMNRDTGTTVQRNIPVNDSASANMTSTTAQTALLRRHNGMVDTFA